MTVIGEFTVPAEAFALGRTFETMSDVTIEVERLATHSREWVMPFLWASTDDFEALEETLRNDPTVDEFRTIENDDESTLGYYNVHWSEAVEELIDQIVDQHGIVQEAQATGGVWNLKLQFVDRDSLEEFHTYFRNRGYSFELQRLYEGTGPKEREYDLSPEQREALVTALEMGYFAIPRVAKIGDLATELGISTNAVSERLRRATANLTGNTLTVSPPQGRSSED